MLKNICVYAFLCIGFTGLTQTHTTDFEERLQRLVAAQDQLMLLAQNSMLHWRALDVEAWEANYNEFIAAQAAYLDHIIAELRSIRAEMDALWTLVEAISS